MVKIEIITLRVNNEEKKHIESLAKDLGHKSVSDYIRDVLLHKKQLDVKEIEYLIYRLSKFLEALK